MLRITCQATDGYAGLEGVCRDGRVTEVACMAHIRRKFFDAHASQGSAIAAEALERIAQLYAIEETVRGQPPDIRAAKRQAEAAPILEDLRIWLEAQLTKISGKTQLAAAIRYALTRMKRLTPWLEHGFLELYPSGLARKGSLDDFGLPAFLVSDHL